MRLKANCKINIGLDIIRRREDGFHDLVTVMCPVRELYDVVTLELTEQPTEISFRSEGLLIDCPEDKNLCIRAARLMQQRYRDRMQQGLSITLDKRVPFGAGLGGGSADATAVIIGINDLYELQLSETELINIAAELGSDTAFFVRNTPQLCTSRGEVMQDFPLSLDGLYIVLIKPEGVNISTREAFAGIKPATPETPLAERLSQPIEAWQTIIKNDFEPHIFEAHPTLAAIKEQLKRAGATYTAMSGSGSTIFALFKFNPTNKISEQLKSNSPYIFEM